MINKNYKIITIVIMLFPIYVAIAYKYINETKNELFQQRYTEVSSEMKHHLETLIEEKKEAVLLLSLAISQNNEIKKFIFYFLLYNFLN